MKKQSALLMLIIAFGTAGTYAAEKKDPHAGHHAPAAKDEAVSPEAQVAGGNDDAMARQMKRMRDLMERIQSTDDLQVRKELLDEHLEAMREAMGMLQEPQPDKKKKGGDPATKEMGMDGGMKMKMGMMKKHAKVEMRLSALEAVMKQMLEREAAEQDMEHGK